MRVNVSIDPRLKPGLTPHRGRGSNWDRPVSAVSLTYPELAARLGRSEDAVKSLVKRKRWRRSIGNDGLARVTLDDAELTDMANPDRRGVGRPPANSTWAKAIEPRSNPVHDLQAKLAVAEALAAERKEMLDQQRQQLEALGRDLTSARELAAAIDPLRSTVEALRAALDAEKHRLSEIRDDRDRWRAAATARRPWWRRLAG